MHSLLPKLKLIGTFLGYGFIAAMFTIGCFTTFDYFKSEHLRAGMILGACIDIAIVAYLSWDYLYQPFMEGYREPSENP